jgi:hypothetical protein
MKSLTRYVIAAALLICSAGFCGRAQSQTRTPKKGSVAGKVTIKGKPAAGIFVSMRTSDSGSPYEPSYKATTDQEGKYRVTDVPVGSYQVYVVAPAFVIANIQGTRELVVLGEGESVEGIDFALVRGGVITGKVTDADGRPAIEQRVNLLGAETEPNQRLSVNVYSGVQTDDRGVYRMFGLTAGHYRVAAGQSDEGYYMNNAGRPSFKQSFYTEAADSSDASKASVIEVTEGSETANADITLGRPGQTFAASGRIVDGENGQPIAGARFGLQYISDERTNSFVGANSTTNSKGEFKVENLPAGKYGIFLVAEPNSDFRSDLVAFEIVDQDISGVLVKSTKGAASLAGSIVLENTDDKAVLAKLSQLRIQAFVQNPGGARPPNMGHTTTINADGSFRLGGLEPGIMFFSLGAPDRSLVKGFTISRVERDGVVEPRGLEIKNGDQITGVRLVLSYGNATVRGVVKFEDGPLPAGAHVYIRLTKDGETRPNMQSMQPPQVDSRGHFIIQGIPGGLYYFETNIFVPGVVTRPRPPVKQQVNVLDGVVTDVTITLDNPKPALTPP